VDIGLFMRGSKARFFNTYEVLFTYILNNIIYIKTFTIGNKKLHQTHYGFINYGTAREFLNADISNAYS